LVLLRVDCQTVCRLRSHLRVRFFEHVRTLHMSSTCNFYWKDNMMYDYKIALCSLVLAFDSQSSMIDELITTGLYSLLRSLSVGYYWSHITTNERLSIVQLKP
jgi:hypothetical protein